MKIWALVMNSFPIFYSFKNSRFREMADIDQDCGTFNKTYPDDIAKMIRQGYYASVSYVDHEFGRVLDVRKVKFV